MSTFFRIDKLFYVLAVAFLSFSTSATVALAQDEPEAAEFQAGESTSSRFEDASYHLFSAPSTVGCDDACGAEPCSDCQEDCCSCAKQKQLTKAAKGAYKGVFYDNNFDYLCDPCYDDWHLGETLKRLGWGDSVVYDIGGQYRLRSHNERNMRGLGLTGNDDAFLLQRTRLYTNVEIGHRLRFYGEMIDATSSFEDLSPRPIEENRVDILNLFVDGMLFEGCCGDLWGRIGQQELLYGAQRTISPLDWANTRRTFFGGKLFWQGANWNVDAFWTRPVPDTTANVRTLNQPDHSQEFMGVYGSYLGLEKDKLDLYFIKYLETDGTGFEYNTFGARWQGSRGALMWDAEGAFQFGDVAGVNNDAGFYTLGFGHEFQCACWEPTFWAYFDWAKGKDAGPAGSAATGRGYHHLFPLAHKYMGFMDLYGRRNLEDLNFQFSVKPHSKVKLLAWWHIFHLQAADVPYNVVMGPSASLSGGDASLGQELDLIANFNVTPRVDFLLGYSHFFAGDFYSTNTSPGLFDGDADFYYTQVQLNF